MLVASAIFGWLAAHSVSDYTKGGWEIHFIQRGIGLNLHFHHWYCGIPLGLLAFAIIESGLSLQCHFERFLREISTAITRFLTSFEMTSESPANGIRFFRFFCSAWDKHSPHIRSSTSTASLRLSRAVKPGVSRPKSIFRLPPRSRGCTRSSSSVAKNGSRAKEREEISESYLCPKVKTADVIQRLDDRAAKYLTHKKQHIDRDTKIQYGHWRALNGQVTGEWQLDYVVSPFDAQLNLLVVRLQHVPMVGCAGQLDDWIREMDAALQPLAVPAINGPDAATKVLGAQQ